VEGQLRGSYFGGSGSSGGVPMSFSDLESVIRWTEGEGWQDNCFRTACHWVEDGLHVPCMMAQRVTARSAEIMIFSQSGACSFFSNLCDASNRIWEGAWKISQRGKPRIHGWSNECELCELSDA